MATGMFLGAILFLLALPVQLWALPIGTLRGASGDVQYRSAKDGGYRQVSKGAVLDEGGWVRTGASGWAELLLTDGSRLILANRGELELASLKVDRKSKQGVIGLLQGKLRVAVTKSEGQQTDFRIRNRTVVVGVRGTEFLMLSRGEANVLFGSQGRVSVSGSGKEADARPLAGGNMVQNTRGSVPTDPVTVEAGTLLAEAREIFNKATGSVPPASWTDVDRLPDMLARWNVNYGRYLADRGDYEQALLIFQIAIDLTLVPEIISDARLERGTVQGRHLNNPQAALGEYLVVLEEFPALPQAETALFSAGQTLLELDLVDQAVARFREYLQKYPSGRYRFTIETLLRQSAE